MSTAQEAVRLQRRMTGENSLITAPDPSGETYFEPGTGDMRDAGVIEVSSEGTMDALLPGVNLWAPQENTEPLRQRVFRRVKRSRLWNLIHKRQLTEDELVRKAQNDERKALERLLRSESEILVDRMISVLTRRDLCYRYRKHENDFILSGVQKVSFDYVIMQPEAIYLRVDTRRLPRGVGILQLISEDILTDISLSVGHRCSAEYSEDVGCWYIVERASGVRGIPKHVKYSEIIKLFPPSADRLTIPLGYGQNKKALFRSIAKFPHLLVAGTTGSGKTNMLNVILVTLLSNNTPKDLQLVMIDLKGGLAFSAYEGIPHLLPICNTIGIIEHRRDVVPVLNELIHEGERRMETIKHSGHQDIDYYNAYKRTNKMPRILCVIDEFADTKLDREISKDAYEAVKNIAQRMRAVGIHLIMCTQTPTVEVIPTLLKTNLPAKIAFSMPNITGSLVVLDNSTAYGLEPEGRYIFQRGKENIAVQAPYMPPQILNEYIGAIREGKSIDGVSEHVSELTIEEILEYAIANNEGNLQRDVLWSHYKDKDLISKKQLEKLLLDVEDSMIQLGDNYYAIVKPEGNMPRRAVIQQMAQ